MMIVISTRLLSPGNLAKKQILNLYSLVVENSEGQEVLKKSCLWGIIIQYRQL